MPVQIPVSSPPRQLDPWDGPTAAGAVIGCLAVASFAFAIWALPAPLVLPAFSALAIIAAAPFAMFAWLSAQARSAEHLSYWDIAGALTFVGVCAALLSDPEQVIPLLERSDPNNNPLD